MMNTYFCGKHGSRIGYWNLVSHIQRWLLHSNWNRNGNANGFPWRSWNKDFPRCQVVTEIFYITSARKFVRRRVTGHIVDLVSLELVGLDVSVQSACPAAKESEDPNLAKTSTTKRYKQKQYVHLSCSFGNYIPVDFLVSKFSICQLVSTRLLDLRIHR